MVSEYLGLPGRKIIAHLPKIWIPYLILMKFVLERTLQEPEHTNVNFSALILGLSSSALSFMGISHESNSEIPVNLELAKQNIDIIKMLELKTKGNLDNEEKELLTNILKDLQQRYDRKERE